MTAFDAALRLREMFSPEDVNEFNVIFTSRFNGTHQVGKAVVQSGVVAGIDIEIKKQTPCHLGPIYYSGIIVGGRNGL
jgi:hypothetical protein